MSLEQAVTISESFSMKPTYFSIFLESLAKVNPGRWWKHRKRAYILAMRAPTQSPTHANEQ